MALHTHTHRLFMQEVKELNYYKFIAIYFFKRSSFYHHESANLSKTNWATIALLFHAVASNEQQQPTKLVTYPHPWISALNKF
jgi:hypothetical protein